MNSERLQCMAFRDANDSLLKASQLTSVSSRFLVQKTSDLMGPGSDLYTRRERSRAIGDLGRIVAYCTNFILV